MDIAGRNRKGSPVSNTTYVAVFEYPAPRPSHLIKNVDWDGLIKRVIEYLGMDERDRPRYYDISWHADETDVGTSSYHGTGSGFEVFLRDETYLSTAERARWLSVPPAPIRYGRFGFKRIQ